MKFLSNFSYKKLLFNKKFVLAFSLVFAFVFWLAISMNQNPEREQYFSSLPINISTQGTVLEEQGIGVVDSSTIKTASVTVYGPNYIVSSLKNEDIKINAAISDITTPGTYTVSLEAVRNSNKSGYTVLNVNPSTITVKFDYIDTKEFNVQAVANGASAVEGLIAESPVINNLIDSKIIIKGPRTEIKKIDSVVAYADVNKTLSVTTSFDAEIKLYDEKGAELDTTPFTLSEENLKISIPISKKKVINFIPVFSGPDNKNSTALFRYALDVTSATVIGPPETIDSLENVYLSEIDITALTLETNSFEVAPVLPDGVRLLDNIEKVKVTVDLSGYVVRTFDVSRFTVVNKPEGITNVKTPSIIKNVKICGPANLVNSISVNALVGNVDVSGKNAGEHTVNVIFKVENNQNCWQIGTYSISVNLK